VTWKKIFVTNLANNASSLLHANTISNSCNPQAFSNQTLNQQHVLLV